MAFWAAGPINGPWAMDSDGPEAGRATAARRKRLTAPNPQGDKEQ